jgi:tetratricopeptide (TPR) repeat protein
MTIETAPGQPDWHEIEPYLDELLDSPETERAAMLARLEVQRPGIASALKYYLDMRDQAAAKGFLEGAAFVAVQQDSLIGTQIGPYTICALLGRGGMGQVWLAQRNDGRFEGRVAIKFLDSYSPSPLMLERFRREGRLLARLTHAHIARLLDAGVSSDGRPYLVLEYVDGERIDRYCESKALDIPARLRLMLEVLSAVMHAHRNLVVHRDIKPSNVLIASDGSVKLLDFGVGKLLSNDPAAEDNAPTRLEDTAITPEFAAPEQILGETASTATDVYQLGVLLFVLLTDRLPFAAPQTSRADRVKVALSGEAPLLSDAAGAGRRQVLRGDLDAIVAKALRKAPQERYATAAALADDLRRYLNFEPVAARAGALGYRVRKFTRRYQAAVIASALAILALIAATVFAVVQMRAAQEQRDQSLIQARRAERQAEFVGLMMATVGSAPMTAEQLVDAGVQLLDKYYPEDPVFRADALMNLAARYLDLGADAKAIVLTHKAGALAHEIGNAPLIARSECGLSVEEADAGNQAAAAAHLATGVDALKQVNDTDTIPRVECLETQSYIAQVNQDSRAAVRFGNEAIALLERSGETHDVRYASLLGNVADYYKSMGERRTAFEYVERSLAATERNGLGNTDTAFIQLHNVSSALYGFGEVRESCDNQARLIARLEASGRQIISAISGLYALCLLRLNEPEKALSWAEKSLIAAKQSSVLALQVHSLTIRARVRTRLKLYAAAVADFADIDAISAGHQAELRNQLAADTLTRVGFMVAQARLDEAAQTIAALVAKLHEYPEGADTLPGAQKLSANIALAQHRYQEAVDLALQALHSFSARARDPDHSADVGEAALILAQARAALDDLPEAREAARQAAASLGYALGEDSELAKRASALR